MCGLDEIDSLHVEAIEDRAGVAQDDQLRRSVPWPVGKNSKAVRAETKRSGGVRDGCAQFKCRVDLAGNVYLREILPGHSIDVSKAAADEKSIRGCRSDEAHRSTPHE